MPDENDVYSGFNAYQVLGFSSARRGSLTAIEVKEAYQHLNTKWNRERRESFSDVTDFYESLTKHESADDVLLDISEEGGNVEKVLSEAYRILLDKNDPLLGNAPREIFGLPENASFLDVVKVYQALKHKWDLQVLSTYDGDLVDFYDDFEVEEMTASDELIYRLALDFGAEAAFACIDRAYQSLREKAAPFFGFTAAEILGVQADVDLKKLARTYRSLQRIWRKTASFVDELDRAQGSLKKMLNYQVMRELILRAELPAEASKLTYVLDVLAKACRELLGPSNPKALFLVRYNYFPEEVLGLSDDVSAAEAKKASARLLKIWHTDKLKNVSTTPGANTAVLSALPKGKSVIQALIEARNLLVEASGLEEEADGNEVMEVSGSGKDTALTSPIAAEVEKSNQVPRLYLLTNEPYQGEVFFAGKSFLVMGRESIQRIFYRLIFLSPEQVLTSKQEIEKILAHEAWHLENVLGPWQIKTVKKLYKATQLDEIRILQSEYRILEDLFVEARKLRNDIDHPVKGLQAFFELLRSDKSLHELLLEAQKLFEERQSNFILTEAYHKMFRERDPRVEIFYKKWSLSLKKYLEGEALVTQAANLEKPPLSPQTERLGSEPVSGNGHAGEIPQLGSPKKPSLLPPIKGLRREAVPGDGHCLYTAVGLYLGKDQSELRSIVANRLREQSYYYEPIIEGIIEMNAHDAAQREHIGGAQIPSRTAKQYVAAVENGEEWAGDLEISILMEVLDRPIVVIRPDGSVGTVGLERFHGDPIFVYYNNVNHYDAFILEPGWENRSRDILARLTHHIEDSHSRESYFCLLQ